MKDKINPAEMFRERKLIFKLAKNDFKTKFAGSYLGTVWAFVQPVVTILVYWFVFEKGLKQVGKHKWDCKLYYIFKERTVYHIHVRTP